MDLREYASSGACQPQIYLFHLGKAPLDV
jgi:hypothetical protein